MKKNQWHTETIQIVLIFTWKAAVVTKQTSKIWFRLQLSH